MTTRSYDALGRVTSSTSTRGASSESVTWTYDDPGTPYVKGRLTSLNDPTGSTTYRYDRRGLLTREQKTIEGNTFTTSFGHDADGNRTTITYPSGRVATYTYDYANRPVSVTAGATAIVTSTGYLPFGPATQIVFGNGTTKTMQFDQRYRPTENKLTGPGGTIAQYTYTHDAAGNITAITDNTDPAFNRSFGYDDLNRLTIANSGTGLWGNGSYAYDPMGNLQSLQIGPRTASFSYVGTTPKLATVTENGVPTSVAYDAVGNEAGTGTTYSARNHMLSAAERSYAYDGRGIRTITSTPARLTTLTITPTSVTGGTSVNGLVSVAETWGATVALTSSDPAATVPPTVTIPPGSSSAPFTVTTTGVSATTNVVLTASDGSTTRTATLTIEPPRVSALTLSPGRVTGGAGSTGTVTLNGPAPTAGTSVAITVTGTAASAPGTITVPGGTSSGTVPISTTPVASNTSSTITAQANGGSASATLLIDAPAPASLSMSPATVTAGETSQGTVTLTGQAPTGGTSVTLGSNRAEVNVPPSLTIAAGLQSGSFTANTTYVGATTTATITATIGSGSTSGTLTVNPPPVILSSLTLSPTTVVGGLTSTGTITLTNPALGGGATITLTSSDNAIASVPPTVTIPQGSASGSFTIETRTRTTQAVVTISASYEGVTRTAPLTVDPPAGLAILSLTINPSNVKGGVKPTGTVTLTAPVSANTDVTLSSDNAGVASVPTRVSVRRNDASASFNITTSSVTTPQGAWISGTYGGLTQRALVTVNPASTVTLTSVSVSPASVLGGTPSTGTVTLSAPAPASGLRVSLASGNLTAASVPDTVTVASGNSTATFPVATYAVNSTVNVTLNATLTSTTRSATLTVTSQSGLLRLPTWWTRLVGRHVPVALMVREPAVVDVSSVARKYSFYAPELNLLAETETTTATTPAVAYEYVWFGGQPVAQINNSTGEVAYYFNDHLGTPVLQTSTTGAVVWRVEREPYGKIFTTRVGAERHQPLSFPGQEDDGSSDRSYNIHRWYRNAFARYSTSDPTGLLGGSTDPLNHLYAYAAANPVTHIDPLGLYYVIPPDTDKSPDIHRAIKDIFDKLSSDPCCAGDDGPAILAALADPALTIKVDPTLGPCAETHHFGKVIVLGPGAFTKRCCSLASTILHEATHMAVSGAESASFAAEMDCYGCKPTGFPTPDPFVPRRGSSSP